MDHQKDLQNSSPSDLSLYKVVNSIDKETIARLNKSRSWEYGYDSKYDTIVISKTGQIGDIYYIQGLYIALPPVPEDIKSRSDIKAEQYWEREEVPNELKRIKSLRHWNETPAAFKEEWTPYIEKQFEHRENGYWFMNNGTPTYITGSHWFYLQVAKIDVGYPDFREANRIIWIHWEACVADRRCYGQNYLKIRRSGYSFMESSECINVGTLVPNAKIGILSKTGKDAKDMFTDKVVPINTHLPFYFKPVMDGMDKPKTELSYRVPATKITKNNMFSAGGVDEDVEGLNTTIDWQATGNNSYDSQKLRLLIQDESGKWLKPNTITQNWRVTKTCLKIGVKIAGKLNKGKCMMGSTPNALKEGGQEFKEIYDNSDVSKRSKNGETPSGLYALYVPTEWNHEEFLDIYGMPVFRTPPKPIIGLNGVEINQGVLDWWENEVESKKNDPNDLNEFYRQYSRTVGQAFRDESKQSIFNLTKIYDQIEFNDSLVIERHLTRGRFTWKDGIKDTKVVWTPDIRGRFLVGWLPPANLQNRVINRNGKFYPGNDHIGSFGCDPYDISAVVGGRGSNGSLHGMTKFHMDEGPVNTFFLEYIARPQTAEIFFEDVLMAMFFYGMPGLIENNRPRLLYHLKNRGYRAFSISRPDKLFAKLTVSERELGGIPNSSEDVIQSHASAIETYIEKHIGYDHLGEYRDPGEIGSMLFNRTLQDWAGFDINDREKFDASISSGLAIMANQKHIYLPEKKSEKIIVNLPKYSQFGMTSKLINN